MKQGLLENYLIVDSSEPADIVSTLEKECNVLVRRIYVGDYILGDIAIERKSLADFEASVMDGRLFRQASEMLKSYRKAIILLEGEEWEGRLGMRARLSAIARLLLMGASLVCTKNKEESALMIAQLYRKLGEDESPKVVLSKKPKGRGEQRVFVLASIPGVGEKLARKLLERFGSIKNIADASIKEIMEVEKVGEKKAKKIKEVLS